MFLKQKSVKMPSIFSHLPLNHTAESSGFLATTDDIRLIKSTEAMQLTSNLMGLFVIIAKFFCVSLPAAYEHYIPLRKIPVTFW